METVKLIVYGTLREGFGNHRLIRHCNRLNDGFIQPGYGLFINGLPYLVEDVDGPGCFGEIYEIDKNTLRRCDDLENHPHWYCRKLVNVITIDGETVRCWAYIYQGTERGTYVRKF